MKVAIHRSGPAGARAAHVLLAEPSVAELGILDDGSPIDDPRVSSVTGLHGWDVVVTDAAPSSTLLTRCEESGVRLVTAAQQVAAGNVALVYGASLASLARAVAATQSTPVTAVAWTEPGQPPTLGTTVAFPPPVGHRRARRTPDGSLVAPVDGDWAGLVIHAGDRIVGVADHRDWLDAIALASAVFVVPSGAGLHTPDEQATGYLEAATRAGFETAVFRPS